MYFNNRTPLIPVLITLMGLSCINIIIVIIIITTTTTTTTTIIIIIMNKLGVENITP